MKLVFPNINQLTPKILSAKVLSVFLMTPKDMVLKEHNKVTFEIEMGPKGANAVNVKKVS